MSKSLGVSSFGVCFSSRTLQVKSWEQQRDRLGGPEITLVDIFLRTAVPKEDFQGNHWKRAGERGIESVLEGIKT